MNQRISPNKKIFSSFESFSRILDTWKADGAIVFTNGCFDLLHVGHVDYLYKTACKGKKLIVGVNSDSSVRRLKGSRRPLNTLEHRMIVLASLGFVDAVLPFEEDTPLDLIMKIQPNILIKGGDYNFETIVGAQEVVTNGGTVDTIDFVYDVSTTQLLEQYRNLPNE